MVKEIKKNESTKKHKLYNIIELIVGFLIFLIGILIFRWKLVGSRGWETLEGPEAQIFGIIFILYGLYRTLSAIRKLRLRCKK